MQQIRLLLPNFIAPQKHWRHEFIDQFVAGINEERECGYYLKNEVKVPIKPILARVVGVKIGHLKEYGELHYLLSICKDSKNRGEGFSKAFFGSLKIK